MKTPALPVTEPEAARQVAARLQEAGHVALWAGGCVRDMLLGRTPKDYDVATDARPDRVLELFPGSVAVGKSFGVVRVPEGGFWMEVATFRLDVHYEDGRHPTEVRFVSAREDAARRDFTVNALFFDPLAEHTVDYVGGLPDLEARIIRCVGNPADRFAEDHLRMLRAVRIATTLDFAIAGTTREAIREQAASITRISAERVREELTRTLCEATRPGDAILELDGLGLLEHILPEVSAMKGVEQPPQFHPEGDVFSHTVLMLNAMRDPSPILAFAVLLHDVGKPSTAVLDGDRWRFNNHAHVGADMAGRILRRLRLPTAEIEAIQQCIHGHMRFMDVQNMKRSTLRRFVGQSTFPVELELHRLDCEASHGDLANYDFLANVRATFESEPVLPDPWITGRDILELGVRQGPDVGHWKQVAYDAQLDGRLNSREEALRWLREEMALRPATPEAAP